MELLALGLFLGFVIMGFVAVKIAQAVKPTIHVTQTQTQAGGGKNGGGVLAWLLPLAVLAAGVLIVQSMAAPAVQVAPVPAKVQQPAQVIVEPTSVPVTRIEQAAPDPIPLSAPIARVPDFWPIPILICALALAGCGLYVRRKEQEKRGEALAAELFSPKVKVK